MGTDTALAAPVGSASPSLLGSRFSVPPPPAGAVVRSEILDRVTHADAPPVIIVTAPAGYGKTTLLRQWADRDPAVAYVAVDATDDDPMVLLTGIFASLDRLEPLDPAVSMLLATPGHPLESSVLPRLVDALWQRRTPAVLMLDDAHRVRSQASLMALEHLIIHLPPTLRLVLATRRTLALRLSRLRIAGHLLELGPADLLLDAGAVEALAGLLGTTVSREDVDALLLETEGWPAAAYVGLRSLASDRTRGGAGGVRGAQASLAEYMRSELVEPLDDPTRRWLVRTSVLEVLTGPLCDAALETTGSLRRLRELARDNLFVTALDDNRVAYRCHPLFRELLRDELEVTEPDAASAIAARAAAWCAAHDEPDHAVGYATASGDLDLLAGLVARYSLPMHWRGRTATVARWLEPFDRDGVREQRATIAVLWGWVCALAGETHEARHWLSVAERAPDVPMPDGSSRDAWVAALRGMMAASGVAAARTDAAVALTGLGATSPFLQTAHLVAGLAEVMAGSLDAADEHFRDAVQVSRARGAVPGWSVGLAERAIIALARGDLAGATAFAAEATAMIRDTGYEDVSTAVTVHAVAARTALANGALAEARAAIARVHRLRPLATAAFPVTSLQMRFEAIRTCIPLREIAAARALMVEVHDILRQVPDVGRLAAEAATLQRSLESANASTAGPWALTTAELRVLAFLPTHLSFREVAERLFVSPHTVKSQVMAIYGKLGVSSRREAVEQAVDAGLLDASVVRMSGSHLGMPQD